MKKIYRPPWYIDKKLGIAVCRYCGRAEAMHTPGRQCSVARMSHESATAPARGDEVHRDDEALRCA